MLVRKVEVSGAAWQPALMSCCERHGCHKGRINPPAFIAAHQGPTSLPVHAVEMIILPGLDDEDIIFVNTHKQTILPRLTGGCCSFSVFLPQCFLTLREVCPDAVFPVVLFVTDKKD